MCLKEIYDRIFLILGVLRKSGLCVKFWPLKNVKNPLIFHNFAVYFLHFGFLPAFFDWNHFFGLLANQINQNKWFSSEILAQNGVFKAGIWKIDFFDFFKFSMTSNSSKMGLSLEKVVKFQSIGHKNLCKMGKKWFRANSRIAVFPLFPPTCPVCTQWTRLGVLWK